VSSLSYANALGAAPRAVLLVPFLTPLFPLVARLIADGRRTEATRGIHRVIGLLALTAVPAALLLALWATETTQLLLGRGQCDTQCVTDVAGPLRWYALAILGNFLSIFLNRALAAAELQRQILWATVVSVAVTIFFDWLLVGPMAQSGIAAATFIGVYLNLALYLWYLRGHFPEADLPAMGRQVLRLLACGAVCIAAALAADRVLPTGGLTGLELLLSLSAKVAVAVAAYVVAARFLARAELGEAANAARALFRRRRAPAAG
jgi:putative peptidoglycan lipid II flippase